MAISSAKSSLLNVSFPDAQLVITGPQINLRIVTRALELVKEIINARQTVTILDGHFVQLTIINTHAKTSVLLLHNNIGAPHGEELGRMKPFSKSSYNWLDNSCISGGARRYRARAIGAAPGASSIPNST